MMRDLGIYETLEQFFKQALPDVPVGGQIFPHASPPYLSLSLEGFEEGPKPQQVSRVTLIVSIISRYHGFTEIQNLNHCVQSLLDGKILPLKKNYRTLIRLEQTQIKQEKDGVTKKATLTFTLLIRCVAR